MVGSESHCQRSQRQAAIEANDKIKGLFADTSSQDQPQSPPAPATPARVQPSRQSPLPDEVTYRRTELMLLSQIAQAACAQQLEKARWNAGDILQLGLLPEGAEFYYVRQFTDILGGDFTALEVFVVQGQLTEQHLLAPSSRDQLFSWGEAEQLCNQTDTHNAAGHFFPVGARNSIKVIVRDSLQHMLRYWKRLQQLPAQQQQLLTEYLQPTSPPPPPQQQQLLLLPQAEAQSMAYDYWQPVYPRYWTKGIVLPDGVVPVPTETSQGTLQQASGTTQDLTTPPLGRGAVGHALMQWFKPSESERSTKPNGRWFRGIVYDYDDQTKLYWVALEDGRCVFDTQEEWVYLYGNNFLVLWPKQRTQGTGFSTQALSNRESVSADPFDGQRSSGITQQLQLEGQVQEQEQLQQQQQDGQEQERQEAQQQQEQGQEKRDQQQPLQHSPNVVAEPTAAEPVAADERMQPRRVGLKNQGATCYQNVVLQYLYHLPLFRKAVYQAEHLPSPNGDPGPVSADAVLTAMQDIFCEMQCGTAAPVDPKAFATAVGWDTTEHHDMHELKNRLLGVLQGTQLGPVAVELFQGRMNSSIRGINEEFESSSIETFTDAQLAVNECGSLLDSLDRYTAEEELTGDHQYKRGDGDMQDATKRILFETFPPVLQLQLKRFQYNAVNNSTAKVDDYFEYSTELQLDKYLSPGADHSVCTSYQLLCVIAHSDRHDQGHYRAYIRPDGQNWYKFDDSTVTAVPESEAVQELYGGTPGQPNAYMLVYIRTSDWDHLMQPVHIEDIPQPIKQRNQALWQPALLADGGAELQDLDHTADCYDGMQDDAVLGAMGDVAGFDEMEVQGEAAVAPPRPEPVLQDPQLQPQQEEEQEQWQQQPTPHDEPGHDQELTSRPTAHAPCPPPATAILGAGVDRLPAAAAIGGALVQPTRPQPPPPHPAVAGGSPPPCSNNTAGAIRSEVGSVAAPGHVPAGHHPQQEARDPAASEQQGSRCQPSGRQAGKRGHGSMQDAAGAAGAPGPSSHHGTAPVAGDESNSEGSSSSTIKKRQRQAAEGSVQQPQQQPATQSTLPQSAGHQQQQPSPGLLGLIGFRSVRNRHMVWQLEALYCSNPAICTNVSKRQKKKNQEAALALKDMFSQPCSTGSHIAAATRGVTWDWAAVLGTPPHDCRSPFQCLVRVLQQQSAAQHAPLVEYCKQAFKKAYSVTAAATSPASGQAAEEASTQQQAKRQATQQLLLCIAQLLMWHNNACDAVSSIWHVASSSRVLGEAMYQELSDACQQLQQQSQVAVQGSIMDVGTLLAAAAERVLCSDVPLGAEGLNNVRAAAEQLQILLVGLECTSTGSSLSPELWQMLSAAGDVQQLLQCIDDAKQAQQQLQGLLGAPGCPCHQVVRSVPELAQGLLGVTILAQQVQQQERSTTQPRHLQREQQQQQEQQRQLKQQQEGPCLADVHSEQQWLLETLIPRAFEVLPLMLGQLTASSTRGQQQQDGQYQLCVVDSRAEKKCCMHVVQMLLALLKLAPLSDQARLECLKQVRKEGSISSIVAEVLKTIAEIEALITSSYPLCSCPATPAHPVAAQSGTAQGCHMVHCVWCDALFSCGTYTNACVRLLLGSGTF